MEKTVPTRHLLSAFFLFATPIYIKTFFYSFTFTTQAIIKICLCLFPILGIFGIPIFLMFITSILSNLKKFYRPLLVNLCFIGAFLLIFVPTQRIYEQTRFFLLRPHMEKVAQQLAEEYQMWGKSELDKLEIVLPSQHIRLSRSGTVTLEKQSDSVAVAFSLCGILTFSDVDAVYYVHLNPISKEQVVNNIDNKIFKKIYQNWYLSYKESYTQTNDGWRKDVPFYTFNWR